MEVCSRPESRWTLLVGQTPTRGNKWGIWCMQWLHGTYLHDHVQNWVTLWQNYVDVRQEVYNNTRSFNEKSTKVNKPAHYILTPSSCKSMDLNPSLVVALCFAFRQHCGVSAGRLIFSAPSQGNTPLSCQLIKCNQPPTESCYCQSKDWSSCLKQSSPSHWQK